MDEGLKYPRVKVGVQLDVIRPASEASLKSENSMRMDMRVLLPGTLSGDISTHP